MDFPGADLSPWSLRFCCRVHTACRKQQPGVCREILCGGMWAGGNMTVLPTYCCFSQSD